MQVDPSGIRKAMAGLADAAGVSSDEMISRIARLGMTPRQQLLNHLWTFYTCSQYEAFRFDWDGHEHKDPIDAEAIATAGFIPPGFYDAGATFPLQFRRPTAPYHLIRVVVQRFTGLLFSQSRHPQIRVEGDPDTEDYVRAITESARLWQVMMLARTYGGAMGTVAVGFQFLDGKPMVEIHDARWTFPVFKDRSTLRLERVEKRYVYPVEEQDEKGKWVQRPYWYRRVITETTDTVYQPALMLEDRDPDWVVLHEVPHNLGFCPVVWIQNLPVPDDLDGEPDCHGLYDVSKAIDSLIAQANRGILANCDPTVVIVSDAKLDEVRKGSDNAIKIPNGSANYMELSGTGPKAALDAATQFRGQFLEVAQCILEHPDVGGGARTATEIQRMYESMWSKADILREQYGEKGVKPLLQMMLEAARKLGKGKPGADGTIVKDVLKLPPKVVKKEGGGVTLEPRKVGENADVEIQLQWPNYAQPSLDDALKATQAATTAKAGGLVDDEHATKMVAPYFNIEDATAVMENMKKAQEEDQKALMAQMGASGMPPQGGRESFGEPEGPKPGQPGGPPLGMSRPPRAVPKLPRSAPEG